MRQSGQSIENGESESAVFRPTGKLSYLKLLLRYPVLLLAFGPPVLRSHYLPVADVDATWPHFDYWSVFQVALPFLVAARAAYRLAFAHSIVIPRTSRIILGLAFFLWALFAISCLYSPRPLATIAFAFLYLLNLICVFEFLVDVYHNPPDWMQFVFGLRFVCLALLGLLLLVLPFKPQLVTISTGYGIRLLGGGICAVYIVCPVIAIISAYSFLHSLESKISSAFFFLASAAALVASQWRGAEISLILVLILLVIDWARMRKHFAIKVTTVAVTIALLIGLALAVFGSHRVWVALTHNQDREVLLGGSGRVEQWMALLHYSVDHPLGMGYVARTERPDLEGPWGQYKIEGIDNGYLEVLGVAGWLALAVYAIILAKTAALGWRFATKRSFVGALHSGVTSDSIRCAVLLFTYCLLEQMENSEFAIPLRQSFYLQYILIAIILGQSAAVLNASHSVNAQMTK